MKIYAQTREEAKDLVDFELKNAEEWGKRLELSIDLVHETNKFWRENSRQWGYRPGVNSGNGKLEARIPERLLYVLLQHEPDLLTDDKVWNRFIKAHPEFQV